MSAYKLTAYNDTCIFPALHRYIKSTLQKPSFGEVLSLYTPQYHLLHRYEGITACLESFLSCPNQRKQAFIPDPAFRISTRKHYLWANRIYLTTISSPINPFNLAEMTSVIRFYIVALLLTCSQEGQVIALPTGKATGIFPTQNSTKTLVQYTWRNITTTQHPPTTSVQKSAPGTKGVSGCSLHHLENIDFHLLL